jgi:hypothetical protein
MIFTQRFERTVDRDNTVSFYNLIMQLERAEWRPTLAGCKVIIHQHLDQTLTLMIAGHRVGHYSAEGKLLTPLTKKQIKAMEKTLGGKVQKRTFPPPLRLLTYETGHFICSQKRTFSLANDTSGLAVTQELSCREGRLNSRCGEQIREHLEDTLE